MQRFLCINGSLLLLGCLLFGSCKKEKATVYGNAPAIYLASGPDSIRYSFALQPSFVLEDTIWVNVRISGDSSAGVRPVSFTAIEGTTAVAGTHYKLPDYSVPANKFSVRLPVVIYRTPDLRSKEVIINLQLNANDDFTAPFNTTDYPVRRRILLNDILTKPGDWAGKFELRFGSYSLVKYKFMIDVLGSEIILQFTAGTLLINDQFAYKQKVINAWNNYVALHGPLTDENGVTVVF